MLFHPVAICIPRLSIRQDAAFGRHEGAISELIPSKCPYSVSRGLGRLYSLCIPEAHGWRRPVFAQATPQPLCTPENFKELDEKYKQTVLKATYASAALTEAEVQFLTNGLPRQFRHKHVPPEYVEATFDGGMLTMHELARTNKYDLNHAIKAIGAAGRLQKSSQIVDLLVKFHKANQHTLASFFQACAGANQPMLASRIWRRWLSTGLLGPISISALVDCVASYDPDTAMNLLFDLELQKVLVPRESYHHVMTSATAEGSIDSVLALWNHMDAAEDHCRPDRVTVQHVLNALCAARAWHHVHDVFREMLVRSITPDSQLSATLIKVFSWAGDPEMAETLFRQRLPMWDITPDIYHYNALLYGYARAGDAHSVLLVSQEMAEAEIIPDQYTIVALLTAIARAPAAHINMAAVQDVLALQARHNIPHNMFICGALVHALRRCQDASGEERRAVARSALAAASSEGAHLSSTAMNGMITLCWETHAYVEARQQYDTLVASGIQPDARTCDIMESMCEEAGCYDEAAEFRTLRSSLLQLGETEE